MVATLGHLYPLLAVRATNLEALMTEGELLDRLVHALRQRESHWKGLGDMRRWLMNRAVDSCMKDCIQAGFTASAVHAVRQFEGPDYRGRVPV